MKSLVLGLAFLPLFASAQEPVIIEKPVVCNNIEIILTNLLGKYREEPVWIGYKIKEKIQFGLFLSDSGSWTLIQYNDKTACIIGAGEKSEVVDLDSKTLI